MASDVTTLPVHGEVFLDARGGDRSLRVSWHHETDSNGVVVLSLWRDGFCVGSFRLRPSEIPMLIDTLQRGLGGASWPTPVSGPPPPPPSMPRTRRPPGPPSPPPPPQTGMRATPRPPGYGYPADYSEGESNSGGMGSWRA